MTPWILSVVLAVAIALIVAEIKGGLHALARWISARAARTLPEAHVERWLEEWARDLEEGYRDRPLSGLLRAFKLRRDAREMRRDLLGMPLRSGSSVAVKRALDVAVAAAALLAMAPLLAVLMLAVKVDSRGPALFRCWRLGRWNDSFYVVKLRTMAVEGIGRPPAGTVGVQRAFSDPRVTRVGRFLRRTHLDHLPMLVNVLRGDMSLVGPPPRLPAMDEEWYADRYSRRPSVKPGLTGLSQLSSLGSAALTFDDMMLLDGEYAQTWSVRGDVRILLRTIWRVFTGR